MTTPTFPTDARRTLRELLCRRALMQGDFDLASGASSSVYVDVKQVSLTGRGAELCGRGLWSLAAAARPDLDAVGGMTLGADPLVTAIALAAHADGRDLSALIVRKATKEHGTGERVEGPSSLPQDATVVAVDDVVTTGGSTIDAIEQLRDAGFTVDHAVCVVDRQAGGAANLADIGVTLHSLFTLDELVDA